MKLLIRLSKRFAISFILIFSCLTDLSLAEPKDIWKKSKEIKIQENSKKKANQENDSVNDLPQTVFDKEKLDLSINQINQSDKINDKEVIFGLYEPDETKINLNFWSTVDQGTYNRFIKNISQRNNKSFVVLTEKILFTKTNLEGFTDNGTKHLKYITDWLIKTQDMDLIDKVVYQNKVINSNSELIKFLFLHYLSKGKTDKACEYVNLKNISVQSIEIDKFKIFCLVHKKKIKQALSQLELIRETSSPDNFFLEKINFLTGINENKGGENFDNVFNAHLTLITNTDYEIKFEDFSQRKDLRNYFFNSGIANRLLEKTLQNSSANEKNKLNELVIFLERSANEDLYQSKKILEIYKKYNFSFDQLFKVDKAVKELRRPESHAILYQAMLLAQKPETKIKILNGLREKLILNGLKKIAEPIYFEELSKILTIKKDLVDKKTAKQIDIYTKNRNNKKLEFDNNFIFSSELKKLLKKDTSKKDRKKITKLFNIFDKKIKNKKYQLNKKDIAFINVLKKEKIDLPGSLSKFVYNEKVYIPNEIFNAIKNKSDSEAILKTLIFLGNLNEKDDNYTRDILAIIKVFDKIKHDSFKEIFILNEFSL